MSEEDLEKYLLEQAKIEVEHTRSWPAKIMAFYITINLGMLVSFVTATHNKVSVSECARLIVTVLITALFFWASKLLMRNHLSYLKHRNIQIRYQKRNFANHEDESLLPQDWFIPNEVSVFTRWHGWGFYFFIMVLVTGLAVSNIWWLAR